MTAVNQSTCWQSITKFCLAVAVAVLSNSSMSALAQTTAPPLTFIDAGGESVQVASDTWHELARHELRVTSRDGQEVTYEGVLLADLLRRMGMPLGEELKGAYADLVVLVEATDKYRVAFSLVELDPATPGKVVLIAQHRDGKPLDDREGPIRLVIPDEKRHVRWIRTVQSIRVLHSSPSPVVGSPARD